MILSPLQFMRFDFSSVSFSSQHGIIVLWKAHKCSAPYQESPDSCSQDSCNFELVEHTLFQTPEGTSTTSVFHLSFLSATDAVILGSVLAHRVTTLLA